MTTATGSTQEATSSPSTDDQVVVLHVGGSNYAVPIGRVQEIIRVPHLTPVPRAGVDIEGVINLRGRVLPVVNLGARLGLEPTARSREARVVIVDSDRGGVGLLVDGVSEVLRIAARDIEPPSAIMEGDGQHAIQGVAKLNDRLILLLELSAVVGL